MSKAVETVLNNKEAKATDYFELINTYEYSDLSVHKDGNTVISMSINAFEEFSGVYEFKKKCSTSHFTIEESNVESVTGKMLDNMDTCLIEINMKDGSRISICIYHTDTNAKREVRERFYESDVFSLMDYLNDDTHKAMIVNIHDAFGLEVKLNDIKNCSLVETEEAYEMQIDSMTFPLVDDSCNEIYIKENSSCDTILIRPYGQPFMEVSILVARESSKRRNKKENSK